MSASVLVPSDPTFVPEPSDGTGLEPRATTSPHHVEAEACATPRRRIAALDTLRLVASILMIQGHVFTLAVEPSIRATRVYGYHDFVHGFTAPMFLFAA